MSGSYAGYADERNFARVAFSGRIQFQHGAGNPGTAVATDVSRGGMRLHMGRYLRPGTNILLRTDDVRSGNGKPIELKGRVVWSAPDKRADRFVSGVQVIYDEPDAITSISLVVNHAIAASGILGMPQPAGHGVKATWKFGPMAWIPRHRKCARAIAGNV